MIEPDSSHSRMWEHNHAEEVLLAHRELCTQAAVDSMHAKIGTRNLFITWLLKVAGLHDRGQLNNLNIETVTHKVMLNNLPDELTGLRILQLSNLHMMGQDKLLSTLYESLEVIDYELCVLTGGLGLGMSNDVLLGKRVERLMQSLKGNVFAVLGMGDTAQSMSVMRGAGITVLNNEFQTIKLADRRIDIFGAECSSALIDPRFERRLRTFKAADLRIMISANPQFRVLGSQTYFDLMLTGKQSCKYCLYKNICKWNRTARQYPKVSRDWQINGLKGFTSKGLGKSNAGFRFRSRPEIVIHQLVSSNYE